MQKQDGYINPEKDGAQMDFKGDMSYGDYLKIDQIITAQKPLSKSHDEMLFIIQHQAMELWMKLIIHELSYARDCLIERKLQPALKMLARVSRIFEQLNSSWDVLRTMTPSEYTSFRDSLGHSSGFQSFQYRMIEYVLGNRNQMMLKPHEHRPDYYDPLVKELSKPSLYDVVLSIVAEADGVSLPESVLKRDYTQKYESSPEVIEAWRHIYANYETYWDCYQLGEKLVDFEDYFRRWRFNHVTTVERVIGFKRGSGGTSGISYLKKMLDVVLFPELWQVRTVL